MKSKPQGAKSKTSRSVKLRMPIELFHQLKKAAASESRTVNNMAVLFLGQGVTHLESKISAVATAIAKSKRKPAAK